MKLSAVLIVKNEEQVLEKCLNSIQGIDEIIICDTGSTDKTVEIAKKYTDKVFTDYSWNNSFAEARNHAKSKATGDWILSIDADEVLESDITKIKNLIEKADSLGADAVTVNMHSGNTEFKFPRIFKNTPEIIWKGAAHNYISGTKQEAQSDIKIYYGYSPTHAKDPERTFRILKKAAKDGDREKFYLAREYMYRFDYHNAIKWLDKYLKKVHWAPEWSEAYLMKARALWQIQQGEKARDACMMAIKINTHFKEAILFMAEMSGPVNRKRWEEFAENADNSNVLFVRTQVEKKSDYYDELFKKQTDFSRYNEIHKLIGSWVGDKRVLDIGCGRADVAKYIKNYQGFDFSQEAIKHARNAWVGNLYDKENYKDADIYLALEVLEHVEDKKLLDNIPKGKEIIFSVPSFKDPSHLRTYTEMDIHKFDLNIEEIVRFNWHGKWTQGENTDEYILLVKCNNGRL